MTERIKKLGTGKFMVFLVTIFFLVVIWKVVVEQKRDYPMVLVWLQLGLIFLYSVSKRVKDIIAEGFFKSWGEAMKK